MKRSMVTRVLMGLLLKAHLNGGAPSIAEIQELKILSLLPPEEAAPSGNPTRFFRNMMKK